MIQYATKDFSPLNFELWGLNFELYDLNYELRELHESLSLIRGIRVIRSFFHTEKRRWVVKPQRCQWHKERWRNATQIVNTFAVYFY